MEIHKTNNIHFTHLVRTENLIETMIDRPFVNSNYEAYKQLVDTLKPNHGFVGHLGYKGQAKVLLNQVADKYPNIFSDVAVIKAQLKINPDMSNIHLRSVVKPYVEKYGEYINIEI